MLLADIGNTHCHIFDMNQVEHLTHQEALSKYGNAALWYISVRDGFEAQVAHYPQWRNISNDIFLQGAYDTMGVDRKALCLSADEGIFVDAGSAITVDVVEGGIYQGGFIYPGVRAMLDAYASISDQLHTSLNEVVDLEQLPHTTKDGISYGIIAPIKALIQKHSKGKPLYFTGGDGKFLAHFFQDAIYDDTLVFRGMQRVIKGSKIC
jgi:type III pantothenate kinase